MTAPCNFVAATSSREEWCMVHGRGKVECLEADRKELLYSCKLLLLCFYGQIPGPFSDMVIGRRAEAIVEKVDGKKFDERRFMFEFAATARKEREEHLASGK